MGTWLYKVPVAPMECKFSNNIFNIELMSFGLEKQILI